MKSYLKPLVLMCALFLLSCHIFAQTFTLSTNNTGGTIYKVSGSSLVSISVGGTINPGDVIVVPWVSNSLGVGNASATGDFLVTATPSGTSPGSFSWSRRGDIDVVSGTLSSTSTTSTNGFNTINENNRNTVTDRGQSKGRVYFSWLNTPNTCGPQTIYFDVIKSFSGTNLNNPGTVVAPAPAIIGPSCILPNTTYTYSVDPIVSDNLADQIGLDRYFWDISAVTGATGTYFSTDSSSITFTTGSTVPASATISCGFGLANNTPWVGSATSYSTLVLQAAAGTPVVTASGALSGTISATNCITTYTSLPNSLTLSVPTQTGVSYQWSFGTYGLTGNGWNTSPPATGTLPYTSAGVVVGPNNTLTIADVGNQPGTISLKVTDPCGNVNTYIYAFNRQLTTGTSSLITLSNTCTTPGTAVTATLAASANLNNVTWTNANFTFGGSAGTYTITPNGGLAAGIYSVQADLGCASSPVVDYTINVKPSSLTMSPTSVCVSPSSSTGGPIAVTAPASLCSGCTSFAWSISGGSGITANSPSSFSTNLTTNSSPTASTATATYTVASGCFTTGTVSIGINASTPTITGPSCLNYNQATAANAYAFSVPAVTGATNYTWSLSGASLVGSISGQGTRSITLGVSATTSSFTVSCVINTPCGNLTPSITETPSAGGQSASSATFGVHTFYGLNATAPSGSTYQWFEDGTAVSGATSSTYTAGTLNNSPTIANVCCEVTSTVSGCTSSSTFCTPGGTYKILPANGHGDIGTGIKVFPNPNKGEFTLTLPNVYESANVTILDMNGQEIRNHMLYQGDNVISHHELAAGEYILHITVDGSSTFKQIIIENNNSK